MGDDLTISLRRFDDVVEAAYARLFPLNPDKTPERLRWRFCDNPHGSSKFAIALNGADVVGMIALVPTRLVGRCGKRLAYQAIDTAVHSNSRGRGLFVKMGQVAQDQNALGGEVLWGFPNANAAPGWFGRLGWTNYGAVPLLIRPLRSSFILGRIHSRLRRLDIKLVRSERHPNEAIVSGEQVFDAFDPLWRRIASNLSVAVDRDAEWMRWRLLHKPGERYRIAGQHSSGGDLTSFVATKVVEKHGGRLCYVMEAMSDCDGSSEFAQLIRAEIARAADEGAEVALAWCPRRAPNYAAYRKAGFLPFPPRFRPIEINFGARALSESASAAVDATGRWYLSFLDSDTN